MENDAIIEDDSVNLTVWIPFDYPDCAHHTQRLQRANRTGPFGRGWFDLTDRAPGRWIRDHVAFEQFVRFEIAVDPDTLLRLNHLDQLSREMRREFNYHTAVQQKAVDFAAWIEEVLRNCAFQLRWERRLVERMRPAPEFVFHFCILFLVRPILRPTVGYTDFTPMYTAWNSHDGSIRMFAEDVTNVRDTF